MKKALILGLLASVSTAQAGSLTAKPSFLSYNKPAAPAHAPAAPSSGPVIGRNVPQNNTSTAPTQSAPATPTHNNTAATAAAPAAASSGMGGVVGGMAAGALLGAGATMLLSDSPSTATPAATASAPAASAPANLVYTGNVEQDFTSAMLLWQSKHYAELIKISEPYTKCTNCGDKDRFMMELHQLGKRYIGQ